MDWMPVRPSTTPDINDWNQYEQIAYWKSRVSSLEYENRMLIRHLRDVYAKQTEDYANSMQEPQEHVLHRVASSENLVELIDEDKSAPPKERPGEKRRDEMEKLYGQKASRIMGMETAVQLNYEMQIEKTKPPCWPNTPLNFRFD